MKKCVFALTLVVSLATLALGQDKVTTDKVKLDADQTYVVLSTKRIQTMEKELDEVAAKGFRVMYGSPTQQFDMALLLQRAEVSKGSQYTYKILATSRQKTMEKELNEFAKLGYRLLPRTMIFKQGFLTVELVMVMERAPDSTHIYEYDLIAADKESKLHKKIDDAMGRSFTPVTMVTFGEHIMVMEKEISASK